MASQSNTLAFPSHRRLPWDLPDFFPMEPPFPKPFTFSRFLRYPLGTRHHSEAGRRSRRYSRQVLNCCIVSGAIGAAFGGGASGGGTSEDDKLQGQIADEDSKNPGSPPGNMAEWMEKLNITFIVKKPLTGNPPRVISFQSSTVDQRPRPASHNFPF